MNIKIMILGLLFVSVVIYAKGNSQVTACADKPVGADCSVTYKSYDGSTSTSYGTCKTICNGTCTRLCSFR